jgi:hypothetical protein
MSGVDHYKQAERLLKGGKPGETVEEAAVRVAEAQAHATLALAAATAYTRSGHGDDDRAWRSAIAEPPPRSREEARAHAQEVLKKAGAIESRNRPRPAAYNKDIPVAPPPPRAGRRSRDFDPDVDP